MALKPSIFSAFSTLGILSSISADRGGSKTILELESKTLQIVCASPRIVITARELPILKLSPMAFGESIHFKRQSSQITHFFSTIGRNQKCPRPFKYH